MTDIQLRLDNRLTITAALEYAYGSVYDPTTPLVSHKKAFNVTAPTLETGLQKLRDSAEMFLHDLDIPVE